MFNFDGNCKENDNHIWETGTQFFSSLHRK